ncbi:tRNA (adenosine(37)-N6)-dimethylallyltransferase MiaA [Flavimaricola marinus]|uniref:tRNA dimethylallyltransferase n=1 Tax=Flavimaricola marinus TaxID=1819565 RepID=A0A238LDJ6_9RHOB|nr:tRNA (adenosine(37)-N6)-dimethylallyltransferase MiaA [Flavimaricola marinus]SMY07494.1 tRNA dimethylallyltransferase [Flavimaricola marinus]
MTIKALIAGIPADRPVLIAGPTASGKSALAMEIAEAQGGIILNADALQVFDGWRILTARPSDEDQRRCAHALYGHVPFDADYSVGHWLRNVQPYLLGARPIIVGGTGLYLSALTQGLAEIPATPDHIRSEADALPLDALRDGLDAATASRIDLANRARVQRAWEVRANTGRGLADWQAETPAPLLPLSEATALVVDAPPEWLTPRIERRFDMMLDQGAVEEARAMEPRWDPAYLSSKAIGAAELIDYVRGACTLDDARQAAIVGTRQYAKRQRTWFRKRMRDWTAVSLA